MARGEVLCQELKKSNASEFACRTYGEYTDMYFSLQGYIESLRQYKEKISSFLRIGAAVGDNR